ncbi:MAG: hypothetical protein NVS9B13_07590 [Candidatus Acidiferrum sp.]
MIARFLPQLFCAVLLFSFIPSVHAGTLHPGVIAMFPKNILEFAYADLSEARKFSWYAQFKTQSLPPRFAELEHFLASAGVSPNSQIAEVAWALAAENMDSDLAARSVPASNQLLGVALGSFDPESAKDAFKAQKRAGEQIRGFTLYSCGSSCDDLYIAFIDSNTIAFGQHALLERLIEVLSGAEDSLVQNEQLFPLINQANGRGIFWGVLNSTGTHQAIRQMIPEVSQFPQAAKLMDGLTALRITVEGGEDFEASFQVFAASAENSVTLSQLLQAALLFRQYQAGNANPDLASMLQSVRIVPHGNSLIVSFIVTNDQIAGLIQHNTFVVKM